MPITTLPQTLSACVGDTVFLPSSFPVSALADDVEVTWLRVGNFIVEADIGVVTDDYSYKVENISMSEGRKQYFARVRIPNLNTAVNGPSVRLEVSEKPGEFLVTVQKHQHVCKSMSGLKFHAMVLK